MRTRGICMRGQISIIRELIGCYRVTHEMERVINDIILHVEHDGDGRVQAIIHRADGSKYYGLEILCNMIKKYREKALLFDELQKGKDQ